jgi:hypothetical protein
MKKKGHKLTSPPIQCDRDTKFDNAKRSKHLREKSPNRPLSVRFDGYITLYEDDLKHSFEFAWTLKKPK